MEFCIKTSMADMRAVFERKTSMKVDRLRLSVVDPTTDTGNGLGEVSDIRVRLMSFKDSVVTKELDWASRRQALHVVAKSIRQLRKPDEQRCAVTVLSIRVKISGGSE